MTIDALEYQKFEKRIQAMFCSVVTSGLINKRFMGEKLKVIDGKSPNRAFEKG